MSTSNDDLSRLIIVQLNISPPKTSAVDKVVTGEVTTNKKADPKSGRFTKRLINPSYVQELNKVIRATRARHEELTMPFIAKGLRVLPLTLQPTYDADMQSFFHEIRRLADALGNDWNDAKDEAKLFLGDMFNEAEYPTGDEVARSIEASVSYSPVPQSENVRSWISHLSHEQVAAMEESHRQQMTAALQTAHEDVLRRVVSKAKHFVSRIDAMQQGETLYESALTNLREILDLVRKGLVIRADAEFEELITNVSAAIDGATISGIKASETERIARREKLNKAVQKFQGVLDD